MSNTRVGRNPFEKKPNLSQTLSQEAKPPGGKSAKAPGTVTEEQIIGELIDLPEVNWQPLTAVPSQFLKQILARWI